MSRKIYLSRLAITGFIDVNTPKCVIVDIADAHRIKYRKSDLKVGNNLARFVNAINKSGAYVVEKPFDLEELKHIAHFLNKNVPWKKKDAEKAFDYLMKFSEYKYLKNCPKVFTYGLQSPGNLYSLNASVLYAICKAHKLETDFNTDIHQMAKLIKLLFYAESEKVNPSVADANDIDLNRTLKLEIFNILKYNLAPKAELINIMNRLNPKKLENIINNIPNINLVLSNTFDKYSSDEYKTGSPQNRYNRMDVTHDNLINTFENIKYTIEFMTPMTHLEAIVIAAVKFGYDISSTVSPLAEYIALTQKPHFPFDENFADAIRRSDINPDCFDNPRLCYKFNPLLPKCLYTDDILDDLCLAEGITYEDRRLENAYSLISTSYLMDTFVHGPSQKIINKYNTLYDEIDDLDIHEIVCFGIRGYPMTGFTYEELAEAFKSYRCFLNPATSNKEEFAAGAIKRLEILASKPMYPNEKFKSFNSRTKLRNIITQVKLFQKSITSAARTFVQHYENLDHNLQQYVQEILIKILHLAMYMRGWSGTGLYPLSSIDTNHDNQLQVDINITKTLLDLGNYCKQHPQISDLVLNLPLMCYQQGEMRTCTNIEEGATIRDRIEIVKLGDDTTNTFSCVRMSSNRFAASAHYYMQLIQLDPKFNIKDLDHIS